MWTLIADQRDRSEREAREYRDALRAVRAEVRRQVGAGPTVQGVLAWEALREIDRLAAAALESNK